eukprot:479023_1
MATNCNPFENVELNTKIYVSCMGSILVSLTLANILLSAHCIIKLACCNHSHSSKIPKTFVILFCFICFFFCSSGTLWSIHIVQSYLCLSSYAVWIAVGITGDMAYRYGLATLFLLYVVRLHQSFRGTHLSVSVPVLVLCFLSFIVQLIIPCFTTYLFMLGDWVSGLRAVYSQIFINTIFATFLLILFAYKLIQLGRMTTLPGAESADHFATPNLISNTTESMCMYPTNTTTAETTTLTDKTSVTSRTCTAPVQQVVDNQIDVLSPAIKYMICAAVSIVSSNLISSIIIIRSEGYDSERMWITSLLSAVVDEFINLFFLYLQFPMANTVYWKCCTKMHLLCMDKVRIKTMSRQP